MLCIISKGERKYWYTHLLLLLNLSGALSAGLLLGLALLQESLRNENIVLSRNRPIEFRLVRGPPYRRYVVERRWRIAAQVRHSLVANSILLGSPGYTAPSQHPQRRIEVVAIPLTPLAASLCEKVRALSTKGYPVRRQCFQGRRILFIPNTP